MRKIAVIMMLLLALVMLSACSLIPSKNADELSYKDVSSKDGLIQIAVPENYESTEVLNEAANLQVMDASANQFMMTISESKADVSDSYTLDDYYDVITQMMTSAMENSELSDAGTITIDNFAARQFILSGEVEKIKLKYFVTLIETDSYFHQIISWSLLSKYDESEDLFKEIANSFTEL